MSKENDLANSYEHFRNCHERWMDRRNRIVEAEDYKDEWFDEQCLFCKYFIPLIGIFVDDYGACSNPASPFDGIVRFEHDGCSEFTPKAEVQTK